MLGLTSPRPIIGPETSCHPLNQSNAKQNDLLISAFPRFKHLACLPCLSKVILDCFGFTSPGPLIGPENLAPSFQPIRCKRKPKNDLLISAFLRFKHRACFPFESSLANDDVTFALIGRSDYFCFGLKRSVGNNLNVVTSNFIKEVRKVNMSGNLMICVMQKA